MPTATLLATSPRELSAWGRADMAHMPDSLSMSTTMAGVQPARPLDDERPSSPACLAPHLRAQQQLFSIIGIPTVNECISEASASNRALFGAAFADFRSASMLQAAE
jgi:hypothetical protein